MTDNLAPVYLDNKPITLKDPRPKVSAILSASGKPEATDVKWLQFQPNTKSLRSEEVVDRTTDPSKPIYLTSTSKGGAGMAGRKEGEHGITPNIAPGFESGNPRQAGARSGEEHKESGRPEGRAESMAGGEEARRKGSHTGRTDDE